MPICMCFILGRKCRTHARTNTVGRHVKWAESERDSSNKSSRYGQGEGLFMLRDPF